jgi:hypothetical protein
MKIPLGRVKWLEFLRLSKRRCGKNTWAINERVNAIVVEKL